MNSVSKKVGFTLIELMVVISIILIATSILFIGGGGSGDGIKLSSAQRVVSGIAQGARGQALLKNTETRLIIYSDENTGGDPEKYLRYFGIVYWGEDTSGTEGWLAATQGDYLPEGIYFNPQLSENSGWSKSNTMTLDYPRLSASPDGGGSEKYYYYEFNSNGTMASNFENSWLVLQSGNLKPPSPGDELGVVFPETAEDENFNLKSALIFRRVGTTTMVSDPSDIPPN